MKLNDVILVLIAFSGVAFFCKIYLYGKIKSRDKRSKPSFLLPKAANTYYFLPISKKNRSKEQIDLIKKANWALFTFYICLVAIWLTVLVYYLFFFKNNS